MKTNAFVFPGSKQIPQQNTSRKGTPHTKEHPTQGNTSHRGTPQYPMKIGKVTYFNRTPNLASVSPFSTEQFFFSSEVVLS